MFLSITEHGESASELSFLLHKHPGKVQCFELPFGTATVFYPELGPERCRAVLLVEVDPVALVRSKGARQGGWALAQYVNDRPFACSSFLTVAISRVLGSALNGRCPKREEAVERARDLEVGLPALAAPGGEEQLERLFGPLGYEVTADQTELDPDFPEWGASRHASVTLRTRQPLHRVLQHLYVLIPAMDRTKHYWVGPDEIDKLVAKGEEWLGEHPEKEWIVRRYLKYRRGYTHEALARLQAAEDGSAGDDEESTAAEDETEEGEAAATPTRSLHVQRLDRVVEIVNGWSPASLVDLGCGEGKLLLRILDRTRVPRVVGMDVSSRALAIAEERIARRVAPAKLRGRLDLLHGSLIYRDRRLEGFEIAALVEVIEHLDPDRLRALERVVFGFAAPQRVVVTTPNREYNSIYGLAEGQLRHGDHRFEWTRAEFADWCGTVAKRHGYRFGIEPVGEEDPERGGPSQLAVFVLAAPQGPGDGNGAEELV